MPVDAEQVRARLVSIFGAQNQWKTESQLKAALGWTNLEWNRLYYSHCSRWLEYDGLNRYRLDPDTLPD